MDEDIGVTIKPCAELREGEWIELPRTADCRKFLGRVGVVTIPGVTLAVHGESREMIAKYLGFYEAKRQMEIAEDARDEIRTPAL